MAHKYELILEACTRHPAGRVELVANDPSAAFSWAEREAHGRKFEILEDGKSLGSASLSPAANFWILSPTPGNR